VKPAASTRATESAKVAAPPRAAGRAKVTPEKATQAKVSGQAKVRPPAPPAETTIPAEAITPTKATGHAKVAPPLATPPEVAAQSIAPPQPLPDEPVGTKPAPTGSATEPSTADTDQPEPEAASAVRLHFTRRRASVLLLVLLLAALTSGVTAQLRRTPPAAKVTVNVAQTFRIPGSALKLPWPRVGSAEMMVEGLGRLGGVNSRKPAPIGSVAKVMTAYLVLKNHPLSGDDPGPMITVTAADVEDYQSRIPSGQSLVKVRTGELISERQALEALMLPSANNVAHMLGIWVAGTADAFVDDMNRAATELGMTGTEYTDPSGFLPSTVSTAADQVILARAALHDEVFADIIAERTATIPVAGKIKNYNAMLGRDGVFGVKTGSTTEAGGNLVFASRLELNGQVLTIVGAVFNQPGSGTPTQLARVNKVVHKLLTAARAAIHSYSVLPAEPLGTVRTAWGGEATVSAASTLKVIGWPGLRVPVKVTTSAPGASVRSGQTVGVVEARPGPSGVRVELRADSALSDPSWWWKLTRRP
jgi:D-alanyl-D-alanine carboxypeptidase (penicillin-binding protein 5/6)